MDDNEIIQLFFDRSEEALRVTAQKYGAYCRTIAGNILRSPDDCEECISDTYLQLWQSIPPQRPSSLRAYLARLTRNAAITRWRADHAAKRGGHTLLISLEELQCCIPAGNDPADQLDAAALGAALNRFLGTLQPSDRRIFVQRYWYCRSIREIAADCSMKESRVKGSLFRSREKLKRLLEKEELL